MSSSATTCSRGSTRSRFRARAALFALLVTACHPTLILDPQEQPAGLAGAAGHGAQWTRSAAGSASGSGGAVHAAGAATSRRHVILVIGDGMQLAAEVATSRYLYGLDYALEFHDFPVVTYQTSWNVDVYNLRAAQLGAPPYSPESFQPTIGYDPELGGELPYPLLEDTPDRRSYFAYADWLHPDSASTSTAMSTGVKTTAGAIAWRSSGDPAGALDTSPEILRRLHGMSSGFVTTIGFSHARSAGFFAHNPDRNNRPDIAQEMLSVIRPDVLIGGGWKDAVCYRESDLESALVSDEWVFDHLEAGIDANTSVSAAALRALQTNKRLLGLYAAGEPQEFLAPAPADEPGNPRIDGSNLNRPLLSQSTLAALQVLSRDPEGFFLLVQQGHLDWTSVRSDYAAMIGCVWELEQAVRAVVRYVETPGDAIDWSNTTLIVTAGQANGYLRFEKVLGLGELPDAVIDSSWDPPIKSYPNGEITYGNPGVDTTELLAVYAKGFAASRIHEYETAYPGRRIIDNTALFELTLHAAQR